MNYNIKHFLILLILPNYSMFRQPTVSDESKPFLHQKNDNQTDELVAFNLPNINSESKESIFIFTKNNSLVSTIALKNFLNTLDIYIQQKNILQNKKITAGTSQERELQVNEIKELQQSLKISNETLKNQKIILEAHNYKNNPQLMAIMIKHFKISSNDIFINHMIPLQEIIMMNNFFKTYQSLDLLILSRATINPKDQNLEIELDITCPEYESTEKLQALYSNHTQTMTQTYIEQNHYYSINYLLELSKLETKTQSDIPELSKTLSKVKKIIHSLPCYSYIYTINLKKDNEYVAKSIFANQLLKKETLIEIANLLHQYKSLNAKISTK